MEELIKNPIEERLQFFTENQRESLANVRSGEVRLGQSLTLPLKDMPLGEVLQLSKASTVILGIPEDIGIRANHGRAGAETAWAQMMPHLFGLQNNEFLKGEDFLLLGQVNLQNLSSRARNLNPAYPDELLELRRYTELIDQEVYKIALEIFSAGKKLIVVGGGHNNSYPLLKALSEAKKTASSVLNIDPHADLRECEGRHSGNGFSYALNEHLIAKYHIFGMSESGNNQFIIDKIRADKRLSATYMEEIVDEKAPLLQMLQSAIDSFEKNAPFALEVDMDVITRYPASAENAAGFSESQIRAIVRHAVRQMKPAYIHIAEAAPALADSVQKQNNHARFLAQLVAESMKAV